MVRGKSRRLLARTECNAFRQSQAMGKGPRRGDVVASYTFLGAHTSPPNLFTDGAQTELKLNQVISNTGFESPCSTKGESFRFSPPVE